MTSRPREPRHEARIERLALRCLERGGEAVVEEVCRDHPEDAEAVRRLLRTIDRLGLGEPATGSAGADGARRVGDFRLLRRIGGGGMGEVWLAEEESLGRRVALKLIRPEHLPFERSRERFRREMQAASRIDHPNLCAVYRAGESDGVPFLAMRHVRGRSLAELLTEQRRQRGAGPSTPAGAEVDVSRAVLLVEKLAEALHCAHEAGLVHRDVKPGNVLIDADGEPVLVDFGLAVDRNERSDLTLTGEQLGTPAYMAPEQVAGGEVDRRADVYALGVTLYECVTHRLPFEAPSREELCRRIVAEPAPDPREHRRGVPRELCIVLARALEKDPRNRFRTARELADELRRIREHRPILSRPTQPWLRALRWCQRNRAATGILAATLLGLAVAVVLLRRSQLASARYLALAWLEAAGQVQAVEPELAFQCAREALRLSDDPKVVARMQEAMFELRQSEVLIPQHGMLGALSPDGQFLACTGEGLGARLFRRAEGVWVPVPLPDTGWRATTERVRPVFSDDGRELALPGFASQRVHRYDLRIQPVVALPDLELGRAAWSVRYAPGDDPRILVVSAGGATVWDRSGEQLDELPAADRTVRWFDGAFLPGGRIAAAARVWSPDRRVVAELPAQWGVWHVLAGDGAFATAAVDGSVRSFDLEGQLLAETVFDSFVHPVLDPSGSRLLVPDGRSLRLLDLKSLDTLESWDGGGPGLTPAYAPDGRRIASGSLRGPIHVWSQRGELVDVLRGSRGQSDLVWTAGGSELVSVGDRTRVWTLGVRDGVPAAVGLGRPDVAVSPSGDAVVIASDEGGGLVLCDARGALLRRERLPLGRVQVQFVREGLVALTCERTRRLVTWDLEGRPREVEFPRTLGAAPPELLADGSWLLLSDTLPRRWLWPGSGEPRLLSERSDVSAAVAADGTWLALGGFDGTRVVSAGGDVLWTSPRSDRTRHLALSRDARHLLEATSGGGVLWDLEHGLPQGPPTELVGHQSPLDCGAFSPDAELVATAAQDGSIRVWERAARRTILQLRHDGVGRVAFTSAGLLVSAGRDGTVRWWRLDARSLRPAVEALDVPELRGEQHALVAPARGG